jgi:hypothetical protein
MTTPVDISDSRVQGISNWLERSSADDLEVEASRMLRALRSALTAREQRVKELEAESHKHYCMAVAMFFSGKVDDVTAGDATRAALEIERIIAEGQKK